MSVTTATAATEELRLPDIFPAQISACQQVSQEFFDCFTNNAQKTGPEDTDCGKNGLLACKGKLNAYKSCMEKHGATNTQKKNFRVSFSSLSVA